MSRVGEMIARPGSPEAAGRRPCSGGSRDGVHWPPVPVSGTASRQRMAIVVAEKGNCGFASGDDFAEMARGGLEEYNRPVDSTAEQEASPASVFVGRERELSELVAALEKAESGRGSLFLLVGEPGIGKSRLAHELAARALERGFLILWGRCWEAGGAPAYWPWIQALRAHVRATDPMDLAQQLGGGAGHVGQMIPEVLAALPDVDVPEVGDPDAARFQLFDAATSFLLVVSARKPILLVLDDLHAADTASLLLLRFASGELAGGRILVVGSYRDPDPDRDGPLPSELVDLARQPSPRLMPLAGLPEPDVTRFIDRTTGIAPPASLVSAVLEQTEGNPLFVDELVRLLAQERRLTSVAPGARLTIPASVREVIGRRLAHLSEGCRRVLETSSVMGREFELELVARVTGRSDLEILERLDEASRARVVAEVSGLPRRFRFMHTLIRDVLYEAIPSSRRVVLHRRTGEALEAMPEKDRASRLAELAHHFYLSPPGGSWRRTRRGIEYAWRAGDDAMLRLAYEEAARLYEIALQQQKVLQSDQEATRCELLLRLGDAHSRAGELAAAREALADAADLAKQLRDAERLARAAIGYTREMVWTRAGDDRRMIPLLQDALDAVGDRPSSWRVRVLARLACALRGSRDRERSETLARQAVEMARDLGDPQTLLYALVGLCGAIWWPENPDERLAIANEIIASASAIGEPEREFQGHLVREISFLELGDISHVESELAYLAAPADEVRSPAQRWMVTVVRANLALQQGRLPDAERFATEARDHGARSMLTDAQAHFVSHIYLVRRAQDRPGEALEPVREAAEQIAWYPFLRCELAELYLHLGQEAAAKIVYQQLAADGFDVLPRDSEWIMSLSMLAPVALSMDDLAGASILYSYLLPYADRHAVGHAEGTTGSVSRALGILAAGLGRFDQAEKHFSFAIEHNERMGARLWTTDTQICFARMLLTRDAPGDRERAHALLNDALRTCRSLELVRLEREVRELRPEIEDVDGQARPLPRPRATIRREGEYWSIVFDGDAFRLKDSKGLRHLSVLLAAPGREIHALELVAAIERHAPAQMPSGAELRPEAGDAGNVLDERAKAEYAHRLQELESELAEAEEWHDPERASRLRKEIDFLARELAAAVGLGGRDRRAASNAERARVSVTRAIKATLERIAEHSPSLGRHLAATVRTGTFCSYQPDPRVPVTWSS
jgi:AAA ATPase domain